MYLDVFKNGKTLKQCQEENPILYIDNMDKLQKLRKEYISHQTPPAPRINYYISGNDSSGKDLCSQALARSLFPEIKNDDELFFIADFTNAPLKDYDGQPVIIWDDYNAHEMLKHLKSYKSILDILEPYPIKNTNNPLNKVNIINSTQPYINFLDKLSQDGDKGQIYRRIPFIINLNDNDFDLLINKGVINNTYDYEEYEKQCTIMVDIHPRTLAVGGCQKENVSMI